MFQLYKVRLKCLLRNKNGIFWTLLFPIVLATFFSIAFSNLYSGEKISSLPIAVINNDAYEKDVTFQNVIKSLKMTDGGDNLFKVTEGSKDEVNQLLKEKKIIGYVDVADNYSFTVNESSINQTIVVSFLESYKGQSNIIQSALAKDPSKVEQISKELMSTNQYLEEIKTANEPDNTVNYFYALIAMACLFACDWGMVEVSAIQANQSVQGARVNIAPVHKMKLLFCNLLAACTIQVSCMMVLMVYLLNVLHVKFGNQIPYVILTVIVGSFAGISLGAMISSMIVKNKNMKNAIMRLVSLGGSFLAGLMIGSMKYIVAKEMPILQYINPANLITDALYSLYYYDTHTRFMINIILLVIITIIFSIITYLKTRGREYASL